MIKIGDDLSNAVLSFNVINLDFGEHSSGYEETVIETDIGNKITIKYTQSLGYRLHIGNDGYGKSLNTNNIFEKTVPADFGNVTYINEDSILYGHYEVKSWGHNKVYVFCGNMCAEEGMTKEQILEMLVTNIKDDYSISFSKSGGGYEDVDIIVRKCLDIVYVNIPIQFEAGTYDISGGSIYDNEYRPKEDVTIFTEYGDITIKTNGTIIGTLVFDEAVNIGLSTTYIVGD